MPHSSSCASESEEYIDAGDAVICAARWTGRGKGSGTVIDMRQFDLYEFRSGKVVRATLGYRSKEEPLEGRGAAGARRSRRLLSLRDTARAVSEEKVEIAVYA